MPYLQPGKRIKIPVKFVDSTWEFFYGGNIPVNPDTIGTLIVERQNLSDRDFLKKLEERTEHQILPPGTTLLAALKVRQEPSISSQLAEHLQRIAKTSVNLSKSYFPNWYDDTYFVEMKVLPSISSSGVGSKLASGGVWLIFEGTEPKKVISGQIELPKDVSSKPANSLNHALTKLSEAYEPWRMAHTGNIYLNVFYREQNNVWYPLDTLRDAACANAEQALLSKSWKEILRKFGSR